MKNRFKLSNSGGNGHWAWVRDVPSVYVVHYRDLLAKFRDLKESKATFHADDSSFTFESGIGKTTLHWAAVKELWKFQDVWLLLFSKASFSTLPVANLSPELQRLIVGSVTAAGGRIL
ncbi:hypothetical protein F2P44_32970 [Massilia sp. CCM 8695]|uniref:YcxB-like C-terminal domain-containing protein n=1 Tax=Massilia frigida TaxID=2609281 RepID=A0ABX0NK95_9BURK|nr:hypothetical protein [Massilia frigida]